MSPDFFRALVDTLLPGGSYPNGVELPPASAIGLNESAKDHAALALVAAAAGSDETFVSADAARREAVVRAACEADSATFNHFVATVVSRYYEDPRVIAVFGWLPRPPQPMGHVLPPFEEALLESVKERKPLWRAT